MTGPPDEIGQAGDSSPAGGQRLPLVLDDGYETTAYFHPPAAGPPRLPVVYAHGIQSHPGWFVASARALAAAGHPVLQVTRRGSGDNHAARGHAESAGQLLVDVEAGCRFALRLTGGQAVHLLGASWGGKLLAAYAAHPRRQAAAASLTLVAPGIAPAVDVPLGAKIAIAAALLACPHRRFDIPLSDVELFTDNQERRQFLRDDPLRLHRATARFLYASRRLDVFLRRARRGCLTMPTTLLLARRDRIIDNPRTLAATQRLTGGKAAVREFDAAHTIEFEPDPRPFFDALVEAVGRGE